MIRPFSAYFTLMHGIRCAPAFLSLSPPAAGSPINLTFIHLTNSLSRSISYFVYFVVAVPSFSPFANRPF
jgi:hypothetical protein